jgi:hypothetical protein
MHGDERCRKAVCEKTACTVVCPESGVMPMSKIDNTKRAVLVMEVGPPGSPCRRRAQTTASGVGQELGS